jgi:hypothetical protein
MVLPDGFAFTTGVQAVRVGCELIYDTADTPTLVTLKPRNDALQSIRQESFHFEPQLAHSPPGVIAESVPNRTLVRREIGKEQRVKVSNRKGIANQPGPSHA